jgi:hypothetical protein
MYHRHKLLDLICPFNGYVIRDSAFGPADLTFFKLSEKEGP